MGCLQLMDMVKDEANLTNILYYYMSLKHILNVYYICAM